MAGFLLVVVTVLSLGVLADGRIHQSAASTTALPPELAYDTYCQNDEAVRKKLFRSATAEQKSVMTRRQIERWREANAQRLSEAQQTALKELWAMATPAMFEPTDAGRAAMEAFERRADAAFSGREMDQLGPYGPCIAKP